MDGKAHTFPGTVFHADGARTDIELSRDVRAHYDKHAGIRFLSDVLTAIHASADPVRSASAFYAAFPPHATMDALEQRPDLRARVVFALTGGPMSLLRRMSPADLASQIELLEAEDLPPEERSVRAEPDRGLSVVELYLKYLDPTDLCAYLPGRELWAYESQDAWWERPSASARKLMAAQLKSIRKHKILTDSDLIDVLGNEVLERDLPLSVRTDIRTASRKNARTGRAFTDTDLFDCIRTAGSDRDLIDELVECVDLSHLRKLVSRAADVLGLSSDPFTPPAVGVTAPTTYSASGPTAILTSSPSSSASAETKLSSPSLPPLDPSRARLTSLQSLADLQNSITRPSVRPNPITATTTASGGSMVPEAISPPRVPSTLMARPGSTIEPHGSVGIPLPSTSSQNGLPQANAEPAVTGPLDGDAFGKEEPTPNASPETITQPDRTDEPNKLETRPRRRRH